jgi:demethylspheroidene O-methyltransferase
MPASPGSQPLDPAGQTQQGGAEAPRAPTLRQFRNRIVASPRFQRWAQRFPLTRFIARRQASELFDLTAGFVYSQVLAASVQLNLFETLRAGPLTTAQLAPRLTLPLEATERLLRAATALKLIEPAHDRHMLSMRGAALLGNPGVSAMIAHHHLLYADLADPVALLRRGAGPGQLAAYWPYAGGADPAKLTPEQVAAYSALMAASNGLVAEQVLTAYPIGKHRKLLDVGGGEGAFLSAAAAVAPKLQLSLFDLPAVAERAAARFARAGLSARAHTFGGNFFSDELPGDADVISLVRVVHDHDDDRVCELLANVRRALPKGGTLLIAEPMSGTRAAAPAADAYFGFYLLAMGTGRARDPQTLCAMLEQAGFVQPRLWRTGAPMLTSLIVAHG